MAASVIIRRFIRAASLILALMIAAAAACVVSAQSQPSAAPATGQNAPPPPGNTAALPTRIDPKAQAILDRTLQALGGAAFMSFKTLTTHGRLFSMQGGGGGGFVYYESEVQYPDKRRLSYGLGKKSKTINVINNGDTGWETDPMGLVHMDSKEVLQWKFANRYGLENLVRLRIHEPGVLVQVAGVDFVLNVTVNILDMVDAEQTQIKLYLNKQTGLPVEIGYRKWNPEIQDWNEYSDIYSDYQTFQGIATPMHITRSLDGQRLSEVYRSTAVYNDVYPASLFADPSVAK